MFSANLSRSAEKDVYDLIGLGFGPSNLALSAAVEEEAEAIFGRRLKRLFFERRPHFSWHPAMLIDGALVVATGGVPAIPDQADLGTSRWTFHSHKFLERLHRDFPDRSSAYRLVVVGSGQSAARIFLQGFCEDTHGLSDTLLSNLPVRSLRILRELCATQRDPAEERPGQVIEDVAAS